MFPGNPDADPKAWDWQNEPHNLPVFSPYPFSKVGDIIIIIIVIKCHYRQGGGQPAQLPEDQQERECDGRGDGPPPLQGEEPGQIHGQYRQYISCIAHVLCCVVLCVPHRARLLANQTALKRQKL